VQESERFVQEFGRFVHGFGRSVQTLGRFVQPLGSFVQLLGPFVQPSGRFVQMLGRFVLLSDVSCRAFGESARCRFWSKSRGESGCLSEASGLVLFVIVFFFLIAPPPSKKKNTIKNKKRRIAGRAPGCLRRGNPTFDYAPLRKDAIREEGTCLPQNENGRPQGVSRIVVLLRTKVSSLTSAGRRLCCRRHRGVHAIRPCARRSWP
jgi:hypothetical protein